MSDLQTVSIIGSGPAGWTAAIYLARANMNPVVFAGDRPGGQLMLTTVIENFPGFPQGVDGPVLMQNMREQAVHFGTTVIDSHVERVDFSSRPFGLFAGGKEYRSKAVLIATGAETVWLGIPGEERLIGRGVSSCAVCDAAFFRDKATFVVGGGDAAMEDALALTKFAQSVTIVHRRDSFRASKIMQDRVLSNPKVKVMWNTAVTEIIGEQKVENLVLEHLDSKTTETVKADGIFVAIGHKPATGFLQGQVALDDKGFVLTRLGLARHSVEMASSHLGETGFVQFPTMTSVEGVFAAGDVVDFRFKQAISAAGFGCMASLDAQWWVEESAQPTAKSA